MKKVVLSSFIFLCVTVLAFVIAMTATAGANNRKLLEDSIKAQLASACITALKVVDVREFVTYEISGGEIQYGDTYLRQIGELTTIKDNVNATFIYAVKRDVTGQYFIVLDTDTVNNASFTSYTLSEVHTMAFNGKTSTGIMNVKDKFGSFNTGAAPIKNSEGVIVGIICVDIEDTLISKSIRDFRLNFALLITVLSILLIIATVTLYMYMTRIGRMQDELNRLANYDKLTELPNRRYLFKYLDDILANKNNSTFALYFVDVDNFKRINDFAGHDEGDAFLVKTGNYLHSLQNSQVFRPGAGSVNIAARVGGDEFILVVPNIDNEEQALEFGEEIIKGFAGEEFSKYIEKYQIGLSVGVTLYPKHSANYHVLIKYADSAMYFAKRDGKSCCRLYRQEMNEEQCIFKN